MNIVINLCMEMNIFVFILPYVFPLFGRWSSSNHSHFICLHILKPPPPHHLPPIFLSHNMVPNFLLPSSSLPVDIFY